MPDYTLRNISEITGGKTTGPDNTLIENISYDSRKLVLERNSLFIAIKGERHDGHDYIEWLYQKGVRNFLISELKEPYKNLGEAGFLLVQNSLTSLQKLAAWHRKQFSVPLIGITGSNGKTIVKEWLSQCLNNKYRVTRNPKSYNSQLGVPLSLWNLNDSSQIGIFEAGISLPGEMEKLEEMIRPDFGILTNIGDAHQENFRSKEEKLVEKLQLFRNCKAIFYCLDHEIVTNTIAGENYLEDKEHITWSAYSDDAYCKILIADKSDQSVWFSVSKGPSDFNLELPFTDRASIENASMVICFLLYFGYNHEEIIRCIASLTPIAMRLERIRAVNRCTLINDTYNSDINSLQIAIDALNHLNHPTRSIILSDILQGGIPDEELYTKVALLIRSAGIREFIGIGKRIIKCKHVFNGINAYFHENTNDFLKRIYLNGFQDEAILLKGARKFGFEEIVTVLSEQIHSTRLEINLNNLIDNLNYFRKLTDPQTKMMVMVKALSYGSGTTEIATILQHEKIDYLGVAYADEGIVLRESGIVLPIMVMSPGKESYRKIIEYNLEPEIYSLSVLHSFEKFLTTQQIQSYPIHLKLETGMYRQGFMDGDIEQMLEILKHSSSVKVQGIFSHLAASSNPEEDEFTLAQLKIFEKLSQHIIEQLNIKPIRYIANSAAIERFRNAHYDMVRLGIGLHGISSKASLKPVSTLKTSISQIKNVPKGKSIGYNRREIALHDMRIGIVPLGYADGLDRRLGNRCGEVFINGKYAKIIGDVCMDMIMIDLTDIEVNEYDEVIIFGEENTIDKLAGLIGTIPYEILTNISARVKRVYINE